jgi:hypothetical protein
MLFFAMMFQMIRRINEEGMESCHPQINMQTTILKSMGRSEACMKTFSEESQRILTQKPRQPTIDSDVKKDTRRTAPNNVASRIEQRALLIPMMFRKTILMTPQTMSQAG